MTAKEYLSQAYLLDKHINSKLRQIEQLRTLTRQITPKYDSETVSHSTNTSALQETIAKLMDAEDELNAEIDHFVDLKQEIADIISEVSDSTQQLILEMRYIGFMSWDKIAETMGFTKSPVFKKHAAALSEVQSIMKKYGVSE